MKCLELLNRMVDIQKEMQEEEGFVSIRKDSIQISPELFRELFPNIEPSYSEISHSKHYIGEIAGVRIAACEVGG